MFEINIFIIVFIVLITFILFQILYYNNIFNKNYNKIEKIDNFTNKLDRIDHKTDYILDDSSLNNLLQEYNNLNNNT
jgi:hypothetical protein